MFSVRQRSAYILFDGNKTVSQVLAATAGIGLTAHDVDYLVEQGFLSQVGVQAPPATAPASLDNDPQQAAASEASPEKTPQQRYLEAKPIATQLSASMGLRGFRLNLSVEAASGYDDLLSLLPRLQEALGARACRALERALKG